MKAKYRPGDRLCLKVGKRMKMNVLVLEVVLRRTPHYRVDWAEQGFNSLLNEVAIPEKSFSGLADEP